MVQSVLDKLSPEVGLYKCSITYYKLQLLDHILDQIQSSRVIVAPHSTNLSIVRGTSLTTFSDEGVSNNEPDSLSYPTVLHPILQYTTARH